MQAIAGHPNVTWGVAPAYIYHHLVVFDETNLTGNVYFAHYLHWQGHCREHFLAEHAPEVLHALNDGLAMVTVSCSMEYLQECRALDTVEVRMRLRSSAANRVEMSFEFYRSANGSDDMSLAATGRQVVATMQRHGDQLVPTPVPTALAKALRPFVARP